MNEHFDQLCVEGISVDFNPVGGNLWNFCVQASDGSWIRPLHTAPWATQAASLSHDIPLVERQLSGDFFCAPFGGDADGPIHGWTANGHWQRLHKEQPSQGVLSHCYQLTEPVQGASVSKTLMLKSAHPFVYQCHKFAGGSGHLPIAHHAMIHVPGGAKLSFSKRQFGVTPTQPLEQSAKRGHSMLLYPQVFDQLKQVYAQDGKELDLTEYPCAKGHEDIVVLAGADNATTAWSAALAKQDGFLFLAIKDARVLPETVLWMSNGGRHYPPWNSRHTAVLGIEEAATSCHSTHSFDSVAGQSPSGIAGGLNLGPEKEEKIRYCLGATAAPQSWSEVTSVDIHAESMIVSDVSGDSMSLPFDGNFFA